MIVGVLSDSHGHADVVRAAVRVLREQGAEVLFHCGDVGGMNVLDELLEIPAYFVWGNTDRPDGAAHAYCQSVGLPWPEVPVCVEINAKRIILVHGHEPCCHDVFKRERPDFLFHGHSHQCRFVRRGNTVVVNPGALHRVSVKSVATVDLGSGSVAFHEVPTGRLLTQCIDGVM